MAIAPKKTANTCSSYAYKITRDILGRKIPGYFIQEAQSGCSLAIGYYNQLQIFYKSHPDALYQLNYRSAKRLTRFFKDPELGRLNNGIVGSPLVPMKCYRF